MIRLALLLSVTLAAPALADGVWLKGRGDQVWVEQIAANAPERDNRHGFTRVARTKRPVVYVDAEPVGWHRGDHSPTVVVRYRGHSDHYRSHNHNRRHYRSYSYPRYRNDYGYDSYRRHNRHGYRSYDRGHSYRGSNRNRHFRGTRHGRIRHHRSGAFGKARGFRGQRHRGDRRH